VLRDKIRDVKLSIGDLMLLVVRKADLAALRGNENLLILNEHEEDKLPRRKAWLAFAIMTAVVAVAGVGLLPIVTSAILGCIALIATRCLGNDQAYQAVDWRVIIPLARGIPLGIAMQKSGLAQGLADLALNDVGRFGPLAVLAVIYLITSLLTEVMSNNAAAVLVTPIAYSTAVAMDVSPSPFLVAVLFAAS